MDARRRRGPTRRRTAVLRGLGPCRVTPQTTERTAQNFGKNTQVPPTIEKPPFSNRPKTTIEPMTTIATIEHRGPLANNTAVSPTIYSSGFSSPAIHRAGSHLHQTSHTAQLANEPRPFYAKQTQFPKRQNEHNILRTQHL